ncbi:hypothetical protein BDBG_16958 [Blastomyces gilchristii SLH14081]|uniref:Uncharacterized protein n=1 Tax=Blastomyces gilchristii (strain SLH14081) TaxID=559298 RepID=A0A179UJ40_BLAGS|nr:uncharacterized protein BDBG_16958 [Blastomyces gilchristii SLH14081]OAT08086.1 hypothetical protein BDBG_16958 [Blastomyces gilchristii SLH14081]
MMEVDNDNVELRSLLNISRVPAEVNCSQGRSETKNNQTSHGYRSSTMATAREHKASPSGGNFAFMLGISLEKPNLFRPEFSL